MMNRRAALLGLGAVAVAAFAGSAARAHHGWRWAEEETIDMTGAIQSARLGNPHGILLIDVKGEQWTVEVGQPWRNRRAGLKDEMLVKGVTVTISGHRSSDPAEKRIKAERVMIDGRAFDLYPNRD